MAFVAQLWLPILVSAVLVFVLSAAAHMVLPWHKGEWGRIADQDKVQADRKSTRLNSSHSELSRMPSSA